MEMAALERGTPMTITFAQLAAMLYAAASVGCCVGYAVAVFCFRAREESGRAVPEPTPAHALAYARVRTPLRDKLTRLERIQLAHALQRVEHIDVRD
jgi:hypothetical protein